MTEYRMSDEVKKQLLFDPAICTGVLFAVCSAIFMQRADGM
jgi:hypothetical protein